MKPYLLQMLKELALLGGIENRIEVSSMQLAEKIETSQQTASRYLLELDKEGYIKREMGIKKQLIQITEKGSENLHEEFLSYKQIFSLPRLIHFVGKITSGMKEGTYYTSQEGYRVQFDGKLGFVPFPGTLNVEIDPVEKNKLRFLKQEEGILIDSFDSDNRSFGGVKCFPACINKQNTILIFPLRGHYSQILEFISPIYLRDKLSLKDGDTVEVVVTIEKELSCGVFDEKP
jgi:riboflavin kinase, archaea type